VRDERRPVVVGVAQLVQRDAELAQAPSPLDMLERVARAAAQDAGAGEKLLRELDTVAVVDAVLWRPRNAPALLAERLHAKPRRQWITAVGGEMPLVLVNRLARAVAAGELRLALVASAHNLRTLRRAHDARVKLDWPAGGEGRPERIGANRRGSSAGEAEYGLSMPADIYPIFENALRARRGLGLEAHRRGIGELMSRFTQVAARNPHAWFPQERSAAEIAEVTPSNRMIAYPYTKYMNAVMETDQAVALLVASAEAARALGIRDERCVHWWGGGEAREAVWYPSERPSFSASPPLREAAQAALAEGGAALADVACLDFYSCFPVAVEMACDELGLAEDDPRGFTVTGGLPYAGGPGNGYTLHALAALVERLRAAPGTRGLATGNGWYLTKHSATLLASAPREAEIRPAPPAPDPEVPETSASTEPAEGAARLETYTVLYDRDGAPARGIAIGRTQAGRRFVANTPDDRALLEAFAAAEQVGRPGRVRHEDGRNLFEPG
jgi:acetyl-CoA C-acetyltransferase